MAEQIITNNSMFIVYTDTERKKEQLKYQNEYNKVKNVITRKTILRIVKKPYGYVGIEDKGKFMYPLQEAIRRYKEQKGQKIW